MWELRVFAESSLPILTGNNQVYIVHSVPNFFALRQSGECRQMLGIPSYADIMGELRVFAESSLPILTGNNQGYVVHRVPT